MTILLLDDEQMIRDVAAAALERAGFTVITAVTGEEALAKAQEHEGEISLFITDQRLAGGRSGRDVAEELLKARPGMPVLHISGYPIGQLEQEGNLTPGGFYLAKPFRPRELADRATEILRAASQDGQSGADDIAHS